MTAAEQSYTAAEYVDGCVYTTTGNELQVMRPGEYVPTKIGDIKLSESSTYFELSGPTTTVLDMAYDYSTDTMYAIGSTTVLPKYSYVFLYTVDLDTAEFTQVGDSYITSRTALGVATLACDLDGTLYCVERGQQLAKLYKLGFKDGHVTCKSIGDDTGFPSSSGNIQSMTFDHNTGNLYWANFFVYTATESQNFYEHNLIQLDLETGKGTVLGPIGGVETCGLYVPYDRGIANKQVERITLEETGWQYEGQTQQLQAAVFPVTAEDQRLIWSSGNEKVASVDENGVVTAKEAGKTTITVTSVANPECSASCEFTVRSFDGKEMRGYLADVGNGAPGWIQFHAAAPEEFTVLRETPGLHITGADSGKGVVYASGYTDDDRTEALFCLDPDTLEVQERINVGMPFADITYASGHDMIFFVYQTYFGFVPLTALTLGENTYPAGTALYFDLSDWVGDDYLTGVSDELYDNDFSWFTVITASGLGYSLTLSPTFQLMVMSGIDLEVEAFSEQGNSLIYSHSPDTGNAVYYYSVQNQTRQETTLYAITGDMNVKTQTLVLGSFGDGKAPLTGIFVDYLAEAGLHGAELPESLEGEPFLTLEASDLQVYRPPMTQEAQP